MAGIIVSKVKYFSLAKVLAIFTFFMMLIYSLVDLVYMLALGKSVLIPNAGWSTWVLGVVILLVISPIVSFVFGYVVAFIVNLALKASKGLEIETL